MPVNIQIDICCGPGTAEQKIRFLEKAGIHVVDSPEFIPRELKKVLKTVGQKKRQN